MSAVSHLLIDSFAGTIAARLGLRLDHAIAGDIVERRARARGLTVAGYLLEFDEPGELRELASELTVGETYFFRHTEQLDAFVDVALPARLAARAADRQLRVLSAGCSSGEEPYTLAMLLQDRVPADWQVELHGVDIDGRALARAADGRYSRWSLRAIPPAMEQRWFQPARNLNVLSPALRARVQFTETNLATDTLLWRPRWDMVFCRNVLMYFTEDHADAVIARIVQGLAPGGYLFLGHAEIVWSRGATRLGARTSSALAQLETCNSNGTFYYRRRLDAPAQLATSSGPLSLDWLAGGTLPRVERSDRDREHTDRERTERTERSLALRHAATAAALAARNQPGRLDAALDALALSSGDDQDLQLQRALMMLAQTGGGG